MEKYLIDTNVFWEILCNAAGVSATGRQFDIDRIKSGECFISELTKIEIMSVMGKYARGDQEGWQLCNRIVKEDGTKCTKRYFKAGHKKWENKRTAAMRKLVRDILNGDSSLFQVGVLHVSKEVIAEAEKFIQYAFKYKFASLDAMIAGTAAAYDRDHFIVVTHDKSFRRALAEEGIHIMEENEGRHKLC